MSLSAIWWDHIENIVKKINIQHLRSPETTLDDLHEWALNHLSDKILEEKYTEADYITDYSSSDYSATDDSASDSSTIDDATSDKSTTNDATSDKSVTYSLAKRDEIMLAAQYILFRALKKALKRHKTSQATSAINADQTQKIPVPNRKRKRS